MAGKQEIEFVLRIQPDAIDVLKRFLLDPARIQGQQDTMFQMFTSGDSGATTTTTTILKRQTESELRRFRLE